MKKFALFIAIIALVIACGDSEPQKVSSITPGAKKAEKTTESNPKGVGPIKEVTLNTTLDAKMIASGKGIYELKCSACHKLTDQRVVGPGWAGVTERRQPEWIMNMVTNVEEMLEKDPVAKEQLKTCLVRMPNQNLSKEDARDVLEFMLENDGK